MVAMRFLLAWPLLVQGLQQAHFSFLHVSPDSLASSSTTGVCSDANLLNAAKLRALVEVSRSFNDTTPLDEVLDVIARMHQLRKHMVLPQPAANVASIAAAPAQLRSMALKAAAPEPQMVHVLMGWLSLDAILMLVTLVVALAIALAAVLSCLRASREEMRAAYAQIDAVKAEARETLRVMASRFAALQAERDEFQAERDDLEAQLQHERPVLYDESELSVNTKSFYGAGMFGTVVSATLALPADSVGVALKRSKMGVDMVLQEAAALLRVGSHPNIVRCMGLTLGAGGAASLALEALGRDLGALVDGWYPDLEPRSAALDLARGLAHVHSLMVLHCDIRPENYLVDAGDYSIKLCDFGSSVVADFEACACEHWFVETCGAGALRYKAPELLTSSRSWTGTAADVWAMNLVVLFTSARQHPWSKLDDAASLREAIINIKPPWVEAIPQELEIFAPVHVDRRPTAAALLHHLFEHSP